MHQRVRELWLRAVPPSQRKLAIVLAGLVVAYTLVGFLVVPRIINSQIQKQALARLHRQATVQNVRFNPYTLTTRLIGFDLRDRDGTPLVAFDTLLVNLDLVSLVDRAWVLHEIRLVRPQLVARILKDRTPAIADLFVPDSTTPVVRDTTPSRPPRLKIDLLSVRSGEIQVINEAQTPTYHTKLEDLGLTLERFSTLPAEEGDHYLTVHFATGAEIKWAGKEVMQPLGLTGRIAISSLHPARIAEALAPDLPLAPTSGEMGGSFSYDITQTRDGRFVLALSDATLTVKDLAIRPKDAYADWLKVGSIEARGFKARWPDRVATLDLLRVANPWVTATRKADSTISWMPYLRAMQARDSGSRKAARADTTAPWSGRVTAIEVDSGTVHLEDETVTPKVALDISRIQVRIDSVGTDPRTRTGFSASLSTGKKAAFSTKGSVVRQPFAADFDVGLSDVDLSMAQPYLGPNPPIYIAGGLASIKGKVKMRETRPKILFEGVAGVSGLVINDTSKAPLLSWKDTRVKGIRRTSSPDLLRVKTIEVDQPFARIAISRDRQTNLAPLASLSPANATPTEPYHYEISQVLIKDAEIDFSDESLILPFRTRVHSTQGAIRDVASFGGTPGTLELEGKIDEYGLARANGSLHVSDPYAATSIKAEFRNVEMPTLTPYTAEFLGYAIKEGRLDVDMDYTIQNRQLHAEHHVVAKNMQLGDKVEGSSSGAPGFAVKLAVSLLKDRQGNIKLDPLVEGTVDNPEFSYKKIVWQAIKQVLGKIASAPFHFLGKLFGGESPELVEFDAGRTEVIPPERQKLDSLAVTLQEKPELTISIQGRYDSLADAAALREAKLKAQIEAQRDTTASKTQKADTGATVLSAILENLYIKTFSRGALDSLRAAFTSTPGAAPAPVKESKPNDKKKQAPPPPPPPNGFNAIGYYDSLRAQLVAAQPVERSELVQLGKDRADSVLAALTATKVVDSSRVKVTEPAPAKKKKSGSSRVASEMSMDAK